MCKEHMFILLTRIYEWKLLQYILTTFLKKFPLHNLNFCQNKMNTVVVFWEAEWDVKEDRKQEEANEVGCLDGK